MQIIFQKFHGAGNDFILIDGMKEAPDLGKEAIRALCHRQYGIGADGLIILKPVAGADFLMDYYNSDGSAATMCGNGARCSVAFARKSGLIREPFTFLAGDGMHTSRIYGQEGPVWDVEVSMSDVVLDGDLLAEGSIHTGTPHLVRIVDDVDNIDVMREGAAIRYSDRYRNEGTNVNWMETGNDGIRVRTYEKGVEQETLACGTGITACAIMAYGINGQKEQQIRARGGDLQVRYETDGTRFTGIHLRGPATFVYQGAFVLADFPI